jgi:hypothetical protein
MNYSIFGKVNDMTKSFWGSLFLALLLFQIQAYSQTAKKDSASVPPYSFIDNTLFLYDSLGQVIDSKQFHNADDYLEDLDGDDVDELVIIDREAKGDTDLFTTYVYALDDAYYLVDSIYSGRTEPYLDFNEELNASVIVSGIPGLDSLLYSGVQDTVFSPVHIIAFDGDSLICADSTIYNTYMDENSEINTYIEDRMQDKDAGCSDSHAMLSAIISIYVNYRHASEYALANPFFSMYYVCPDKDVVKKILDTQ